MAGNSITGSALRDFDIYLSLITKITINRYKRKGGKHQRREVAQAREETDRFIAFRSHWQFDASFCTPGKGHEKGGVEGEAGFFRRNHLVPVPQAPSLAALNELLLEGCRKDFSRIIGEREKTAGELFK